MKGEHRWPVAPSSLCVPPQSTARTAWSRLDHKGLFPTQGHSQSKGLCDTGFSPIILTQVMPVTGGTPHSWLVLPCQPPAIPVGSAQASRKGQGAVTAMPVGGPQYGNNVELWKAEKTVGDKEGWEQNTFWYKHSVFRKCSGVGAELGNVNLFSRQVH